MPILDVDGARISYSDSGSDAPIVLFGHGLLFGGWMFREQIAALRDRYRCVTIDWRGQGESPVAAAGFDMDTLAGDAVALIRHLGGGPVHWVGLSMGGFVGLRLATRHGSLVRSLTLLDTSAGPEDPAKAGEYRRLALAQTVVGVRPLESRIVPILFGPAFAGSAEGRAVIAEWARRLRGVRRTGTRKAVLGVANRASVEAELGAITVPTLIAAGTHDKATPPGRSAEIAARVPGSRLELITDCGHTSSLEQPTVIADLLTDFLASAEVR